MPHQAAVLVEVGSPLQDKSVPTQLPSQGEVQVRVDYIALSPLDIWRSRHGLLVKEEKILGGTLSGHVLNVGSDVVGLERGDLVSAFTGHLGIGTHQEILTLPSWCLSKLPDGYSLEAASTINDSLVSAIWSLTQGGLQLPLFDDETSSAGRKKKASILVWGGASSVGHYALQVLQLHRFNSVIATASSRHADRLKQLGASQVVVYNDNNAMYFLRQASGGNGFDAVLDCIGDVDGSLAPCLQLAKRKGGTVAAMLPYVRRNEQGEKTLYMNISETSLSVPSGVTLIGVRTHNYFHHDEYKEYLQPTLIPRMLQHNEVLPASYRVVGKKEKQSLAERINEALNVLEKGVSGQRIVVSV